MTTKEFFQNVALILIMTVCCIFACYVGLTAAIDHMDARQTAWSVARGER